MSKRRPLLTVAENKYLAEFIEHVRKNEVIFAHVDEDSEEEKIIDGIIKKLSDAYEELTYQRSLSVGLWVIDRNPKEVSKEWIDKNAFQIT